METVREAVDAVELAFSDQIAAGAEAEVNTSVEGDAAARYELFTRTRTFR